jgi:YVTN family beta-propeller protein
MRYFLFLIVPLLLLSCKKDKDPVVSAPPVLSNGFLVLNEGLFQHNNSTLTWMPENGVNAIANFFEQKANRALGDTGNDMQRYGNKIYIIVNVSSTIEVLNASTGASLGQISMMNGNTPKQPRYIAFNGNKAYVSCYDGFVDVIDTTSLSVIQRIPVGANPEKLVVSNNKLFVANSGGLNFPNVDSTVSIISLSSHTELTRVTVGPNPGKICTDQNGNVFVISRGDYGAIPAKLHRIDPVANTKTASYNFTIDDLIPYANGLMVIRTSSGIHGFHFDPVSEQCSNTATLNFSGITTYYGATYRNANSSWYVFDANGYTLNGFVKQFNQSGSLLNSYAVGLNPNNILFYD